MKRLLLLAVFFVLISGRGFAAEPIGDWQVEDGSAHIRIVICRGSLWGVIGWEKTPGKDTENPDPAKRTRPTLGHSDPDRHEACRRRQVGGSNL